MASCSASEPTKWLSDRGRKLPFTKGWLRAQLASTGDRRQALCYDSVAQVRLVVLPGLIAAGAPHPSLSGAIAAGSQRLSMPSPTVPFAGEVRKEAVLAARCGVSGRALAGETTPLMPHWMGSSVESDRTRPIFEREVNPIGGPGRQRPSGRGNQVLRKCARGVFLRCDR
jgi:hypothetical protein